MLKDLPKDEVVNKTFRIIGVFYNDTLFQSFDFKLSRLIQCVVSLFLNSLAISE